MWKRARKRLVSLLVAAMTLAALFPAQRAAHAVTGTVANLVVFVRFSDDSANNFQAAWPVIDEIYNGTEQPSFCFTDYIRTISGGRLSVTNVFPQHFSDEDVAVLTLEHGASYYTDSTQLVSEVVRRLKAALNPSLTAAGAPALQSVLPEATQHNETIIGPADTTEPATGTTSESGTEPIVPDGTGGVIEPPEETDASGNGIIEPSGDVVGEQPTSEEIIIAPAPPVLRDTVLIDDPSEIPGTEEPSSEEPPSEQPTTAEPATEQPATEEPPSEEPSDNDTPTEPTEEILPGGTVPEGGLVDAPLDAASVPQAFATVLGDGLTAGTNADRFQFGTETLDHQQAGIVDNLTLIVQTSIDDEPYYPHRAVYPYSANEYFTLNGTDLHIGNYNVLNTGRLLYHHSDSSYSATNGWAANALGGRGLVAHEFMHSLGFPDLYNYYSDSDTPSGPVGGWDIMAQTSNYLQYPLSYFRREQGWLDGGSDVVTLNNTNGAGTHTLNAVSETSGTRAYILTTPRSNSEFFVLEYRHDPDGNVTPNPPQYECRVPENGLIVYRINNNITNRTNAYGGLYTYVFRPDTTVQHSLDGTALRNAALNGTAGDAAETSLGTTNLADTYANRTIYYSDGANSGIAISNVTVNGTQLSFDLSFADYATADAWPPVGNGMAASNAGSPSLAVVGDTVYAACTDFDTLAATVKRFDGDVWTDAGSVSKLSDPQLKAYNGSLYLLGVRWASGTDPVGQVLCYRLSSGGLTQIYTRTVNNPGYLSFSEGAGLYATYAEGNQTLRIVDLTTSAVVAAPLSAGHMAWPAVCKRGNDFYVLYCDMDASTGETIVQRYDGSQWIESGRFSLSDKTNQHSLLSDGTKLYALMVPQGSAAGVYAVFDGTNWSAGENVSALSAANDVQLLLADGIPYISYIAGNSGGNPVRVIYRGSGGWTQYGEDAFRSSDGTAYATAGNGNLYVAAISADDAIVRYKAYASTPTPPDPPPVTPSYVVRVTRPAGYTDTKLWIDGVPYQGALSGSTLSVDLRNSSTAKTVTMYSYKANGVPNGMYVWTLRYRNNAYTATAIPAFQNLLSYHGFSVRVTGKSGIRFKTGIVPATRAKLIASGGLSGYRLVEYGTLSMFEREQSAYPMVKESNREHVWLGRAYWTENGKTNDLIFETKDGRYRFTSVLVGIPRAEYGTNFAFRGYIVLSGGGQQITLYGPIVARSIRYVAQQVLSAREFPAGSASDAFLRSIVN